MSIEHNIDYYSDFRNAIMNNAVMVSIDLNNTIYPKKAYRNTNWLLKLNESRFEFTDKRNGNSLLTIDMNMINQVEIGLAQTFLGEAAGIFMNTVLLSRVKIDYNNGEKIIVLCESLEILSKLFHFVQKSNMNFTDLLNVQSELNNVTDSELREYLTKNYQKLLKQSNYKIEEFFYQNLKTIS
ncbi:hypothetical protein HPT25_16695 [Bacillus sp. BRMEA1]|uniref:hypothetical protein n=1 Tax=Neobacillus endophyticus TaxID=2738405 RepID=UPI0015634F29|nr:hypothetical protein [Neobacillus endophyticus]NRD79004.1 hypothetical protein [Neobacillus endophyticus]